MPLRPLLLALSLALTGLASSSPALAAVPASPRLSAELSALQPVSLLPTTPAQADYKFYDLIAGDIRAEFAPLAEPAAGLAFRANVPVRGAKGYDVEAKITVPVAVKKGDVALARFMARTTLARQESGEGAVSIAFGRGVAPHERSVAFTATPGPDWALFQVPFAVDQDYAAGESVVALAFASLVQTIEISHLEVLNFDGRARLDQLPKLVFTYRGREADAPWRAAALQRIEKIRTAPLAIRVTDSAGQPIAGARVEAHLIQPEFIFGTAVDDSLIVAETPDALRYRATILELFDTVVIENGLKWGAWNAGPKRQAVAIQALDWIDRQGLRHKGHNLIWPSFKFSPRSFRNLPDPATALPKLIADHITEIMPVTKGRSYGWDVVNEPLHERDYFDHMPELAMADWFKLAQSLDPDAQLFINEYSMLNSALSPGTITRYRELIQRLRLAGAPIGGIGVQGHVGQQPRAPEQVLTDLDLLAGEGLPVQITEFDINTPDEQIQADYTRDFLIACYSHPTVTGFIMWGFWQPKHWKPDAAMFRKDWSEKPNAAVWRDLVLDKWNTRLDATTPADGTAGVRGHLGRYRVTVTRGGIVNRQDIVLPRAGAEVVVVFP